MRILLICAFLILAAIGAEMIYYLHSQRSRLIPTYIDGKWKSGEYRGCILIPPDRARLYCAVHGKHLPWAQVLSENEMFETLPVAFRGEQTALFWRCQRKGDGATCEASTVATEKYPR